MAEKRRRPKHSRLHYSEAWTSRLETPYDLGTPGADPRERRPTDFSYMSSPPGSPEIAYLWRRFVSARDAVNYFKVDDPGLPSSITDPEAALQELRRTHRDLFNRRETLFVELRSAQAIYEAGATKTPRSQLSREPVTAVQEQLASISDEITKVIRSSWPIRQHLTDRKSVV